MATISSLLAGEQVLSAPLYPSSAFQPKVKREAPASSGEILKVKLEVSERLSGVRKSVTSVCSFTGAEV